jgi:hypothetical protein
VLGIYYDGFRVGCCVDESNTNGQYFHHESRLVSPLTAIDVAHDVVGFRFSVFFPEKSLHREV